MTLAFVVSWLGCGSEPTDATQTTASLQALELTGVATYRAGSPVGAREFSAQVLTIVSGGTLSADGTPCPEVTQHVASVRSRTREDGSFSVRLVLANFSPVSHQSCRIRPGVSESAIQAIRISAVVDADPVACSALCAGDDACTQECASRGKIRAEGRADTPMATLTLRFEELAPRKVAFGMPDLQIDATVARSSWSLISRAFEPDSCAQDAGCVGGPGLRRLLVFDSMIVNAGDAPLVIGSPGEYPNADFHACHQHYHVGGVILHELLSADGSIQAQSKKEGFCLMDLAQVSGDGGPAFDCAYQGISPGWADVYDRSLDCQWLDVTGVPPGAYTLRLLANPDFAFEESDFSNNEVSIPVVID